MKNYSIILICFLSFLPQAYSQKPADKKATKETVLLYNKLTSTIDKGIMIGHQDDLVYGHSWNVDGVSDVKQTVGDFPAVFGWELGDLELGNAASLDGVVFENLKNKIQWVNAQGGINTISWHCNNPLTGKNAWDVSSKLVVKSVLPGGEKNELFVKMLNHIADFLLSLKDEKGKLIPVIFRPWHEHTGSWFWWGQNLCSTDEYVALWKYTVSNLQAKGVHNLLYAYSSASGFNDSAKYMERYPGDEIVDLLGFDEYQGGIARKSDYIKSLSEGMGIILPIAKERNKIAILSETGCETLPDPKWWTETLWPSIKDYPIAYVLFWRNAHDKPNHYYMPFPGQTSEADFKEFAKIDRTLFLNDVAGMSKSLNTKNKYKTIAPKKLKHTDIGNPAIAGKADITEKGFDITAGGADIWGKRDEFHFSYQIFKGDFDFSVQILSLNKAHQYTKAGIMARADLTDNSQHVYFQIFPDNSPRNKNNGGCEFQYRMEKAGEMKAIYPDLKTAGNQFDVAFPDTWIRLKRVGDVFESYVGNDNKNWRLYSTFTLKMPVVLYVGPAVTSHSTTVATIAKFGPVQLRK